jgi:hypothetical protein
MMRRAIALLLALVSLPATARAHDPVVHQDLTDLAYELMLVMDRNPAAFTARHPGDEGWAKFIKDAARAPYIIRDWSADLPKPQSTTCIVGVDADEAMSLPSGWPYDTWYLGRQLGAIDHAVGPDYAKVDGCGLRKGWSPGGILSLVNNGEGGKRDYSGLSLGYWAQHIDDEIDDSHIWMRPTNSALNPVSWYLSGASAIISTYLAVYLAPFLCAWDYLTGNDENCWRHAKEIGHDVDPVENLEGLLPGVFDSNDQQYTGMWHHINLGSNLSNDYDDIEGFYLPDAGYGHPGLIDVGIMAVAGLAGLSVNYDDSNGPKRYQIEDGDDDHENTTMRNKAQWQFHNIGLTAFEPLDNLAYYGWRNFKSDKHARWLGWPLHAFGDAVVPMHTIASPGWGHRPWEDAVAEDAVWRKIRYLPPEPDAPPPRSIGGAPAQLEQLVRIAERAYEWRKRVLAWRERHAGHDGDVPVRDLITELARQTHDYSFAQMDDSGGEWPFDDMQSVEYKFGSEAVAVAAYSSRADMADRTRPLVENGAGAILAFLTSAAEVK